MAAGEALLAQAPATPESPEPLSALEERFCLEYLTCYNAAQTYLRIKPGIKYDTARTEGPKILAKPAVMARMAELTAQVATDRIATATEVLERFTGIARADQRDIWEDAPGGSKRLRPLEDLPAEVAQAIEEVSYEPTKEGIKRRVKFASKLGALDKLAQYHKLLGGQSLEGSSLMGILVPMQGPLDEWVKQFTPGAASGPGVLAAGLDRSINRTPSEGAT